MEKGEREEMERAFVESDDEGSVLDAFLALLPTEEESFAAASSSAPQKFVRKLQDINSSGRVISEAVTDYAGAKLMRMRCEKRRFPRGRIIQMDKNLLGIYDSINDKLSHGEMTPEEEAQRGRQLLDECKARADAIQLKGFTIDSTVARGELQCIANGEGYEKREISWKRK